jgi:hypothetical protein
MNSTLAWGIESNFYTYKCFGIDPDQIYTKGKDVKDPLIESA